MFSATVNNITVISWQLVFVGGGNQSTQRKLATCRKSLTIEYKFDCEWVIIAIFQLYHGENKFIFNEMMMKSALY